MSRTRPVGSILSVRDEYSDVLESTQRVDLDVTPWLRWVLTQVDAASRDSLTVLDRVRSKAATNPRRPRDSS